MTSLPDLWVPPATANPTHAFRGAGVTEWTSVTIENDTALQLLVSTNPDAPPSTDVATAWRLVPPGANVTWPLGSQGVSYRLLGTPAANTAVQTILSDQAAPAGGTTGTVNVASGTLTVTGPVNVQTATGVNLTTATGFATATTMAINSGTTSQSIPITANVQKLLLLYGQAIPGGASPVLVTVTGDLTGTRYFRGQLAKQDSITVAIAGSSTGISIDTSVTVTIVASVSGGDLVVAQSFAPPALSANDLLPTATYTAATSFNKNLFVHEAHAKLLGAFVTAAFGPTQLIAAPGVGSAIQLHRAYAIPDAAAAGLASLQSPSGTNIWSANSGTVILPCTFDFAGFTLAENTGLFIAQANAVTWRTFVAYSIVTLP